MSKRIMFQRLNSKGLLDISIGNNTIDEKELEVLYSKFETIYFLQPITYSHESIRRNVTDLQALISRLSAPNNRLVDGIMNHRELLDSLAEVQQRFTNVLSSGNAFLSLVESKLKSTYGEHSEETTSWNDFRRKQHKNNVSFRLMYELRNYALHYGLPVSSLKVEMNDLSGDSPRNKVKVHLSKQKILNSKYNWKGIRKDISSLEDDTNLIELVVDYSNILKRIYLYLLEIFDSELVECKVSLDQFYVKYAIPSEYTAQVLSGWNDGDDLSNLNFEILPSNELVWILEQKA